MPTLPPGGSQCLSVPIHICQNHTVPIGTIYAIFASQCNHANLCQYLPISTSLVRQHHSILVSASPRHPVPNCTSLYQSMLVLQIGFNMWQLMPVHSNANLCLFMPINSSQFLTRDCVTLCHPISVHASQCQPVPVSSSMCRLPVQAYASLSPCQPLPVYANSYHSAMQCQLGKLCQPMPTYDSQSSLVSA